MSDNNYDTYNIENYTEKELLVILKSFFKLNLDTINNQNELMKQLASHINHYKNNYNNQTNIYFFERALDKIYRYLSIRPYSLNDLLSDGETIERNTQNTKVFNRNDNRDSNDTDKDDGDSNDTDSNDTDKDDGDSNDTDKDDTDNDHAETNDRGDTKNRHNNIAKKIDHRHYYDHPNHQSYNLPNQIDHLDDEDLKKFYEIFNLSYKSISIDRLETTYTNLKKKILLMEDTEERTSLLNYITDTYQLLRKYMIDQIYGNDFTNTSYKIPSNDLTLNENRYNLLTSPNVIEVNQNQIIQQNTPGTQDVFIDNIPRDVLNPLRREKFKSIVNIDTFLRGDFLNTDASDYIQEFTEPINNVVSMSLASIEMPNIWYTFSEARSSNYINILFQNFNNNENVYDVSYDIIIPDGNYTSEEIAIALNNLFIYEAQHNPEIGDVFANPIYYLRAAIDNITGKTTFRVITEGHDYTSPTEEVVSGASPYEEYMLGGGTLNPYYSPDMVIVFNFLNESQTLLYNELVNRKTDPDVNAVVYNINNINSTLCDPYIKNMKQKAYNNSNITPERIIFDTAGWMFGFREPCYKITINDTYFDPYTSDSVVIYKGFLSSEGIYGGLFNTYLFLSIDDFNNNYKRSVISNNEQFFLSNNILAKIPITTGSNTLLVEENRINIPREYFGPVNIKKIKIKLLDRFGNIVNLNNNNYTFTLELTQLY